MGSFSTASFTFIDYTEMDESMSKKVWECRNLPEIRKWMVNQEPIPYDSHRNFIDTLAKRTDSKYYSVLYDGTFIGSVNIHINENGSAERGIYLHPKYWGKKLAKKICMEFYPYVIKAWEIREITTKVLKENVGSNALEDALGALKVAEDDSFFYYSYHPKESA